MHEVSQLDFHKKQALTWSSFGEFLGLTIAEGTGRKQDWVAGEVGCWYSFKESHSWPPLKALKLWWPTKVVLSCDKEGCTFISPYRPVIGCRNIWGNMCDPVLGSFLQLRVISGEGSALRTGSWWRFQLFYFGVCVWGGRHISSSGLKGRSSVYNRIYPH